MRTNASEYLRFRVLEIFLNKEVTRNWDKVIVVKTSRRESLAVSIFRSSEVIQLISMVERSCSMSGHLRMQTHTQLYGLMLIYPYANDANVSADCRGVTSNWLRIRSSTIHFEFCPCDTNASSNFQLHVFKLIDTVSNKRVIKRKKKEQSNHV